jgi:serine/threonine protein kinase
VKPSNVLLDEGEWAQLADFGLAKILESDQLLTRTGLSMGTPAYFSPEQAQGLPLDRHADLYALGVILYEMVTGRLPFSAETPTLPSTHLHQLCHAHFDLPTDEASSSRASPNRSSNVTIPRVNSPPRCTPPWPARARSIYRRSKVSTPT